MPYRDDVQCFVRELAYDFEAKEGRISLAEMQCTDMTGCIGLFKKIDLDVRVIKTFQGAIPDTEYRLLSDGKWQAFASPK